MTHVIIFYLLSLYFAIAFMALDSMYRLWSVQVCIYLLPLLLLTIFKPELSSLGLIGVPFALLAIATSGVYAHREKDDKYWARRNSYLYNVILIFISICWFALCVWLFISSSNAKFHWPTTLKDYLGMVVAPFLCIYGAYVALHQVATYLIIPILPYTSEIKRGSVCDFYKLVVASGRQGAPPELHYCIVFDKNPSCWQLERWQFKKHIVEQGTIFEYTECTGVMGNKFIKSAPLPLTQISTYEQEANLSKYYPKYPSVNKWIFLAIVGVSMVLLGVISQFVISLILTQKPYPLPLPWLLTSISILIIPLGLFLAIKSFILISVNSKKRLPSPIPMISSL